MAVGGRPPPREAAAVGSLANAATSLLAYCGDRVKALRQKPLFAMGVVALVSAVACHSVRIKGFRLPYYVIHASIGKVLGIVLTPLPASPSQIARFRAFNALTQRTQYARPAVGEVREVYTTGGRAVRLYYPEASGGQAPAGLVWYHGGGWIIGSLDGSDGLCRQLVKLTGAVVASVDYRLAPEHQFPTAHEDCREATEWLWNNRAALGLHPAEPLALGGDSAGGNMALATALELSTAGSEVQVGAVLAVYPVVDAGGRATASRVRFADWVPLSTHMMDWFTMHYAPTLAQQEDWRLRLLRVGRERLGRLPPTCVVLADEDPLLDEGAELLEALRGAGVDAEGRTFALKHGTFGSRAASEESLIYSTSWLRKKLFMGRASA